GVVEAAVGAVKAKSAGASVTWPAAKSRFRASVLVKMAANELRIVDVDDRLVFARPPKYVTYRKDVEQRAKIPWRDAQGRLASFHALRKTFLTDLALAIVSRRVAMDLMWVMDAKLLDDVYTDANLLTTVAAAAQLPRPGGAA